MVISILTNYNQCYLVSTCMPIQVGVYLENQQTHWAYLENHKVLNYSLLSSQSSMRWEDIVLDISTYLLCIAITWSCNCFESFMSSLGEVSELTREGLVGLREAYNDSPRGFDDDDDDDGGLGLTPSNFIDGEGNNATDGTTTNPNPQRRVSQAEVHLLQLLERDSLLDEHQEEEKKRRASRVSIKDPKLIFPILKPHSFPCKDTYKGMPSHPTKWPQRPVMIRPTPYTTTKVRGTRKANANDHVHFSGFCAGCVLPINNGKEVNGDAVVVDFESSHFVGTMLLRIKDAPELELASYQDKSYFDGKKRRFQAIVRGRFKTALKMSECVTGQAFDRPAGKLPARWIVTSFIKFVTTLAPQLEVQLDGDEPRFLTPLVATAHTVLSRERKVENDDGFPLDLEEPVEEPPATDPESLVNQSVIGKVGLSAKDSNSAAGRMKARKKVYNEISAKKMDAPRFRLDKEYTFEFYQHMLDFGEEGLAINMGRPIGKVGLAQATDGQPIKVMSAHKDPKTKELDTLWSFDIWHESLYPFAELANGGDDA